MTKALIAGAAVAGVLLALFLALGRRAHERDGHAAAAASPAIPPSTTSPQGSQGFLYGRIATVDGATYEGRLRFGGDQEAFWGDSFNGVKHENPWLARVPQERRPRERHPIEIFGWTLLVRESLIDGVRPFMAPFGEIARIEARGKTVRVTQKSGTVFDLNRLDASDFDDGVRVWDGTRGVVDLDSLRIGSIELLPTPPIANAPSRLHGTVTTSQGEFTGFIGWNRDEVAGTDALNGRTPEGGLGFRFDTIRSVARRFRDRALVTLIDGREIELTVGDGNRGTYVDDPRYGRVLISWDAFERVDFSPSDSGPAYADFPAGRPLAGSVTTKDGRRLTGRLVFDLDESETTETLDASSKGIDYAVPFNLIASIAPAGGITLRNGDVLSLERTGDLGETNAGMLVFAGGGPEPEYVPWTDVVKIDLDSR